MTFYDRLVKETTVQRKALYIGYLTQAYHHVSHTLPFLMAMGACLADDKIWLRPALAEYIEEEIGHEEWILNDIAAAGGDAIAARKSKPHWETELLIAFNYDYIARKNPVGFLGMVFMLESTSTEIATTGADSLKNALKLPKNAFTYLYSHGSLDIEHLEFFKKTVNKIDDPIDQEAIIDVAQKTFKLFANVIASIPLTHVESKRHAA